MDGSSKLCLVWDTNRVKVITLFVHHSATEGVTTLLVYVDDIIVTGNDMEGMEILRSCLVKEFEIKELGKLKYFLGIEVANSNKGIFIS